MGPGRGSAGPTSLGKRPGLRIPLAQEGLLLGLVLVGEQPGADADRSEGMLEVLVEQAAALSAPAVPASVRTGSRPRLAASRAWPRVDSRWSSHNRAAAG